SRRYRGDMAVARAAAHVQGTPVLESSPQVPRESCHVSDSPVSGEVSNSKLAAVFDSAAAAREAADAIIAAVGLQRSQVKLVTPDEPDANIKLEPEGGGIWRTIIIAHVRLGILGAVLGAVAFAIMMGMGVPFVARSP